MVRDMQSETIGSILKHEELWRAIDDLAAMHRLSPSGLARRAGLDPTTFNKSKRRTKEGKQRWPSTESVAKILDATGASLHEFVGLIAGQNGVHALRSVPLFSFGKGQPQIPFDQSGHPIESTRRRFDAPGIAAAGSFAIQIAGDDFEPTYRAGDILIASPQSELEKGSRALVRLQNGPLLLREIVERNGIGVVVRPVNENGHMETLPADRVALAAKIVWASE